MGLVLVDHIAISSMTNGASEFSGMGVVDFFDAVVAGDTFLAGITSVTGYGNQWIVGKDGGDFNFFCHPGMLKGRRGLLRRGQSFPLKFFGVY